MTEEDRWLGTQTPSTELDLRTRVGRGRGVLFVWAESKWLRFADDPELALRSMKNPKTSRHSRLSSLWRDVRLFSISISSIEYSCGKRRRQVLVPAVRVVVVVLGGSGRVSRSHFQVNSFGRNLYEDERKVYNKFGIYPV